MTQQRACPFLAVDPAGAEPMYRQLYGRVRGAIADGVLKPGDRLPSARVLARELGVARGTIDNAYSLLVAQGYLQVRGQAGTVVTPGLDLAVPAAPVRTKLVRLPDETDTVFGGADVDPDQPAPSIAPFQMGLPALDAFPRKIWARLGARHLRGMQAADMDYPSIYGLPALRRALAGYLQVARGINCAPSQIFITTGYRDTLDLVFRTLLAPGDIVWAEDPGYPLTRTVLRAGGLNAAPVPVDEEGIDVRRAMALAPGAAAAIVTPAHQSPLCVSLSLHRRLALLDWAGSTGAWVIEDDYDGEYRYASRPLPALKSLDQQGRVIYSGTFSKVLFPGVRLAYAVVPADLAERFQAQRILRGPGIPGLTQAIVADFIQQGHFVRHIHQMRKLYAGRREAAVNGLLGVLGSRCTIAAQPGGMHLILRTPGQDTVLAARMRAAGMFAHALSSWRSVHGSESGLLLSFTNIASEGDAAALARRVALLLD